ncbi:MAG: hypothetical protein WCO84_03395 [bacterium]
MVNLILTPVSFAAETSLPNTGFIKSGIWFSKDPFYAGEKIRIYTILFNGSENDLLGEVDFENNSKSICKGDFALTAGRTQEVWCDWLAVRGNNKITAKIVNPKISIVGEALQPVILDNGISGISERKIIDPPVAVTSVVSVNKNNDIINPDQGFGTSSSFAEEKIKENLEVLKDGVDAVAPKEITRESVDKAKDKIISYIPSSVVNTVKSISDKTGISKLTGPLSFVVDFLIAVYKFVINDPLTIIVIFSFIVWKILNYIYQRTRRPF